ncbi:glycoside hydrolase family 75 protein [Streptomyces sp. NPDC007088]|uniref:glycoside hydrolase family 75 protein n=1 Tax=Streptomyces sp. NPDC007088 TaxID=3364773 RepID=UPI0036BE1685
MPSARTVLVPLAAGAALACAACAAPHRGDTSSATVRVRGAGEERRTAAGPASERPATGAHGGEGTTPRSGTPARPPVDARTLLDRLGSCEEISEGRYRTDAEGPEEIPVCATGKAVYWKADLDIDCDGRPGSHCNAETDPTFQDTTAWTGRDGRPLSAERLPYVVVPEPSARWRPADSGVVGGTLAVLIHDGRLRYAVVGDSGPSDVIGEASWKAAKDLGVPADPLGGGTDTGVAYLLFPDTVVTPLDDPAAAVAAGERRVRKFLEETATAPAGR